MQSATAAAASAGPPRLQEAGQLHRPRTHAEQPEGPGAWPGRGLQPRQGGRGGAETSDGSTKMLDASGFLERRFRPEGKMKDHVCALPVTTNKLRLYCLRLSDCILIVGNGGRKQTKTYEEDEVLNGYIIELQKLDALLKEGIKNGTITIQGTALEGINDKIFDL